MLIAPTFDVPIKNEQVPLFRKRGHIISFSRHLTSKLTSCIITYDDSGRSCRVHNIHKSEPSYDPEPVNRSNSNIRNTGIKTVICARCNLKVPN